MDLRSGDPAWVFTLLRALVALALAATVGLVAPEQLAWLLSVYLLADGAVALGSALVRSWQEESSQGLLLEGMAGLAAGAAVLLAADLATRELAALLAVWALFSGLFLLQTVLHLEVPVAQRVRLGLPALVSMLWGSALAVSLPAGAPALVQALGAYGLLFGLTMGALAWWLRRLGRPQGRVWGEGEVG